MAVVRGIDLNIVQIVAVGHKGGRVFDTPSGVAASTDRSDIFACNIIAHGVAPIPFGNIDLKGLSGSADCVGDIDGDGVGAFGGEDNRDALA